MDFGHMNFFQEEILQVRTTLKARLEEKQVACSDALFESLTSSLVERLFVESKFTLLSELKSQGKTGKDAPLLKKQKQAIQSKYPVLFKKVEVICTFWLQNSLAFLTNWRNDFHEIAILSKLNEYSSPVALEMVGDSHNDGKCVAIVTTCCGGKVVYKPRNIDIECSFYELTEKLSFDDIYRPWLLSKDAHGWMQYLPPLVCSDEGSLNRYYHRCGQLLSLFYLLEASDLHNENFVAFGEYPVPVDLETLFHHQDDSVSHYQGNSPKKGLHTICKTYMVANNPPHLPGNALLNLHSSDSEGAGLPVFGGKAHTVKGFEEDVAQGFKEGYERILQHKHLIANDNGGMLETLFGAHKTRYVCRPTAIYERILQALRHQNAMASDANRQKILDNLYIDAESRPHLNAVVDSERTSLSVGDVPILYTTASGTHLAPTNGSVAKGFFKFSGTQLSLTKLASMNSNDLSEQLRLLAQSFGQSLATPETVTDIVSDSNWTDLAAGKIADRIWRQAIDHQNVKLFPLYEYMPSQGEVFNPNNISLFSGFSGTLLFLAHAEPLASEYDRAAIQNLAQTLFREAFTNLAWYGGQKGYQGLSGAIYSLSMLQKIWPEQAWLPEHIRLLVKTSQPLQSFANTDLLSGHAGAIMGLLAVTDEEVKSDAMSIARQYAEHLVAKFNEKLDGHTFFGQQLCGLGHGLSGVGLALVKCGELLGLPHLSEKGLALIEAEHQQFDAQHNHWPDWRLDDSKERAKRSLSAWCTGTIGIGITRAELQRILGDNSPSFLQTDTKRSLDNFNYQQLQKNNALCHGNFGNLELLVSTGEVHSQRAKPYLNLLYQRVQDLLKLNSGESNMLPKEASFMTGWSGIGYQLMRISQPSLPNVMALMD